MLGLIGMYNERILVRTLQSQRYTDKTEIVNCFTHYDRFRLFNKMNENIKRQSFLRESAN